MDAAGCRIATPINTSSRRWNRSPRVRAHPRLSLQPIGRTPPPKLSVRSVNGYFQSILSVEQQISIQCYSSRSEFCADSGSLR